MERRLNSKIQEYSKKFKEDVKDTIIAKINQNPNIKRPFEELLQYIYDYEGIEMTKEDLNKRKRVKNIVPQCDRCCAKRANGEQCSRRKLDTEMFCGTHIKGTPHGIVSLNAVAAPTTEKISVFIEEIQGIFYYLDNDGNVYKPEDIVENKHNPSIIAQYTNCGGTYSIPSLNI